MSVELEVQRATAPALVQDAGRRGRLGEGIPSGGALIPELLALSNRAVGNPAGLPALELYGDLELLVRRGGILALDGVPQAAQDGHVLTIERPTRTRARYLALPGGIDVPEKLGGFGTLDLVGLGGFAGRALRRGDLLRSRGTHPGAAPSPQTAREWDGTTRVLRVVAGPDAERLGAEAPSILGSSSFVVSPSSNRMGTRLLGPALPRLDGDGGVSTPMIAGAMQVPASGEPIVLGPDHPTLGGYPVIAVLIRADRGALFARRPGSEVRFRVIDVEAARAAAAAWDAEWTR